MVGQLVRNCLKRRTWVFLSSEAGVAQVTSQNWKALGEKRIQTGTEILAQAAEQPLF